MKTRLRLYEIHRAVCRRGVPIYFFALERRECELVYDIVRCEMDTKGVVTPKLYRPYLEFGQPELVSYFPNWFLAWGYRLRLNGDRGGV
jgi:hypothetical protein